MPGLVVKTITGSGIAGRPATSVQVIPGPAPRLRSWHNGLTHVTIDLDHDDGQTVTFTGTPGDLCRLFGQLADEVRSAEVEAEHVRALRPYTDDDRGFAEACADVALFAETSEELTP